MKYSLNLNSFIVNTFILTVFVLFSIESIAQEGLNAYDANGKRHGSWKGYYDNDSGSLKYEGTFEHGKETGLFKFYQPKQKNPVATRFFRPGSDTVEVKYLAQNGKTISEGKMMDRQRVGEWIYYHNNSDRIMMTEHYENDSLHGPKVTYFDNGNIAEKANYTHGKLQGEKIIYSEKGVVLEHLQYVNGELHGPARFYNGKGELLTEGNYKKDRHHGIWKYYENGKLKEEKDFSGH